MIFSESPSLTLKQKEEIIHLWNNEYPKKIAYGNVSGFDAYLGGLSDKHHILLSDEQGVVKGWLVYFIRKEARWFAMILDSTLQGQGWGSKFLSLAKKRNTELNGWVIDHGREIKQDGSNYRSPIRFYEKNGFNILTEVRLQNKKIDGIQVRWKI